MVAAMSSTDFTPEHTTATGVEASTSRSADTSHDDVSPGGGRCTPPSPPVPNTPMPAACASSAVDAIVVAPSRPSAIAGPRSRADSFASSASGSHTRSSSLPASPTHSRPSSTAIVAGTAPAARTASSTAVATLRLRPGGRPCASSVLSSATTGRAAGDGVRHLLGNPHVLLESVHGRGPGSGTTCSGRAWASGGSGQCSTAHTVRNSSISDTVITPSCPMTVTMPPTRNCLSGRASASSSGQTRSSATGPSAGGS